MGKAGYEGIHNDKLGNLIIIEDVGGVERQRRRRQAAKLLRLPFQADARGRPDPGQAAGLQVSVNGTPVTFHTTAADGAAAVTADALGEPIRALHSGSPSRSSG